MKKTLRIMVNEVITTVTRRSWLFTTFGLPLISGLILLGVSVVNRSAPGAVSEVFSAESPKSPIAEGYVDESGLILSIPAGVTEEMLISYPDESTAHQALEVGEISAYYVVHQDYLQSGDITYVRPDFNPLSAFDQADLIQRILKINLLGGDQQLADMVNHPLELELVSQAPSPQRDEDNPLTFFLPYAVTMIYYFIILMSATLLLSSMTKEKENRVLEILMSSINARQLMVGKIAGLGLVGLLQAALWVGTGFVSLRLAGRTFSLPESFQLPLSFLLWGLIFFLLGYALYASLMASVGALVPNLREASQATFVVILPLIIPMMMISVLIRDPNGGLATGLSLFPLTAPVVMMTRLSAAPVPLWQLLLSTLILAITVMLLLRAVAGMFRTQTLLSGQPFNLKRLVSALLGRI